MASNQSSALDVSVSNPIVLWRNSPRYASGTIPLRDALSYVRISAVYTALGGVKLRHGRAPAFWRGGDGFMSLSTIKRTHGGTMHGDREVVF